MQLSSRLARGLVLLSIVCVTDLFAEAPDVDEGSGRARTKTATTPA